MPTNTPSAYQMHEAELRAQRQRHGDRNRMVRTHRNNVERAISLNRRASLMEGQLAAFDGDESFRQRVSDDRADWWCRTIFFLAVGLYVGGEFFASGDVAEWLAHQISPLFDIRTEQTPVWLRRAAGVGFVGIMLGVTLLLKFVTSWFGAKFKAARAQAQIGEHSLFWKMTVGIWCNHAVKAAYLVAVAMLYFWLFGFAQERAAFTAAIVAEQQEQGADSMNLGVKLDGGAVEEKKAETTKAEEQKSGAIGGNLALATGVVYVCLWMLHGLVLVLPVDGFNRELEFAHFKRGTVERKAVAMRGEQDRVLRDILERVHAVEGEDRDILIRETQPVAKLVNLAAGRDAMDVPPSPPGDEPQTADASPSPMPPPPSPTGVATAQESKDAFEAIFGKQAA